jgi:hypothetical protein
MSDSYSTGLPLDEVLDAHFRHFRNTGEEFDKTGRRMAQMSYDDMCDELTSTEPAV